jgi:hypothetical protein
MLCDDLTAWIAAMKPDLPAEIQAAYSVVAEKIKQAQRFVLNGDSVLTIHSISESSPKRFLQAIDVCRLPFPLIWVEFAFHDRVVWMKEARKRGVIIEDHVDASPPSRLGFIMEQKDKDGRLISVIPCWSHASQKSMSICHLELIIDTGQRIQSGPQHRAGLLKHLNSFSPEERRSHRWINDPVELEAAFDLDARISDDIPQFMIQIWNSIPRESIEKLVDLSLYDLKSEWRFVLALLTVLNSRNVIEIGAESDVSKLNKAREKKGVSPLMTHREIRLNMSRVQKRRLNSGQGSTYDLQAHLVRGHWKLKRSGLFWWSPFVRGSVGKPPMTTTIIR